MRVRAHYSLLNEIESGPNATLPALEPLIARWHHTRIRRIDRYIQLCVAGGLNCIAGQPLHPQTGVYLASRVGAVSTSAKTMIQTEQKAEMPKPLHFVNTLGNSAGFYLTQLLGLTGTAVVVSQEWLSFESALLHAWLDLQQGRIDCALVGGFDEVPLPTSHQLERLDQAHISPPPTHLTEGTHWLLLERSTSPSGTNLGAPHWLADSQELDQWLQQQKPFACIQTSFTPDSAEAELLARHTDHHQAFTRTAALHGVFSGAALVHLVEQSPVRAPIRRALHLTRGPEGPYCAVIVSLEPV